MNRRATVHCPDNSLQLALDCSGLLFIPGDNTGSKGKTGGREVSELETDQEIIKETNQILCGHVMDY